MIIQLQDINIGIVEATIPSNEKKYEDTGEEGFFEVLTKSKKRAIKMKPKTINLYFMRDRSLKAKTLLSYIGILEG